MNGDIVCDKYFIFSFPDNGSIVSFRTFLRRAAYVIFIKIVFTSLNFLIIEHLRF